MPTAVGSRPARRSRPRHPSSDIHAIVCVHVVTDSAAWPCRRRPNPNSGRSLCAPSPGCVPAAFVPGCCATPGSVSAVQCLKDIGRHPILAPGELLAEVEDIPGIEEKEQDSDSFDGLGRVRRHQRPGIPSPSSKPGGPGWTITDQAIRCARNCQAAVRGRRPYRALGALL